MISTNIYEQGPSFKTTKDIYQIKQTYLTPFTNKTPLYININKQNDINMKYYSKYALYTTQSFNNESFLLAEAYINTPTFDNFKRNQKVLLLKSLLKVIRDLLMNNYEICLFTLLLDNIVNQINEKDIVKNLFFVGILTKYHSCFQSEKFLKYFQKRNKHIKEEFKRWRINIKEENFGVVEINERIKMLHRNKRSDERRQYINYNSLVNEIVCPAENEFI